MARTGSAYSVQLISFGHFIPFQARVQIDVEHLHGTAAERGDGTEPAPEGPRLPNNVAACHA